MQRLLPRPPARVLSTPQHMTEPKKSDHWNSLLDEIGVPAAQKPAAADETAQETVSQAMPPRPAPSRESLKPRQPAKPAAGATRKGSWNSLLGALGLAPVEEPAPRAEEPEEAKTPAERPLPSQRAPAAEYAERPEPIRSPLDDFKPSYRPDESPFPPRRHREPVDDVAPDIDLDADFGIEAEADLPPLPNLEEPQADLPRGERQQEDRERSGRRRRRRRRGGRDEEGVEAKGAERRGEPIREEPESDLDFGAEQDYREPDLDAAESDIVGERAGPEARSRDSEEREGGRRRRRRRGGRSREGAAAGPREEDAPPRRRARSEAPPPSRAQTRAEEDDSELDELDDIVAEDDETSEEHSIHKKIPTWAETVGILIDANMAARSSRQPDRGRSRRPRRDR